MKYLPGGGPAFPIPADMQSNSWPGMTLREWYAGMAFQGMLSSPHISAAISDEELAAVAFEKADAMIAHEKEEE